MGKMKATLASNIRRLTEVGLDAEDIVRVTGWPLEVVKAALVQETTAR